MRPFTEADDVAGFHAAQRDPHLRGRQGLARRAGRARDGPAVRGGRLRAPDRRRGAARSRSNGTVLHGGRPDRDRRHAPARSRPTTCRWSSREISEHFETVLELGRRAPPARRARERRHARGRAPGARASAPRASACAAPSTCSCRRDREPKMRAMIMADTRGASAARRSTSCCRSSSGDFEGIFEAMEGLPVTIRLLDPPLHEFLPSTRSCWSSSSALAATRRLPTRIAELEAAARPRARPRGDEPDARHARLPARASSTRRSTRCRCGRSSAPRSRCASAPATRAEVEIMIPLVAYERELELMRELVDARRARGDEADAEPISLQGRHDDRAAARLPGRRPDRRPRRLLQLRHQRPHPDGARLLARRRREELPRPTTSSSGSSTAARSRRSTCPGVGRARADRGRARPRGEARPEARHLRRARRRPGQHRASSTRSGSTT